MKKRISLISDDSAVCRSIQENMWDTQIIVCHILSREETINYFSEQGYCLIIMDIHGNTSKGIDMLHTMQEIRFAPILVITSDLTPQEKVTLFSAGADVCIEKSVGVSLLVAQANALIRLYMEINAGYKKHAYLSFGTELIINPQYRQVIVKGNLLMLTRKEFDLLHFLASNPQQVLSREQLYQCVWNDVLQFGGERTVKAHISTLRKKLVAAGVDCIENIWGVGYKFIPPDSSSIN